MVPKSVIKLHSLNQTTAERNWAGNIFELILHMRPKQRKTNEKEIKW